MGYFLLYEAFIYDIIEARNWLLKPGGLVLPDKYAMYVCGIKDFREIKLEKMTFWRNIYGIDMSCLGKNTTIEPCVDLCRSEDIITNVCRFYALDLNTC